MSTNYYLEAPECPICHRHAESIHLGKQSAGWAFTFKGNREYDKAGPVIEDFIDWVIMAQDHIREGWIVVDEYGTKVDFQDILKAVIRNAGGKKTAIDPHCWRDSADNSFCEVEFS